MRTIFYLAGFTITSLAGALLLGQDSAAQQPSARAELEAAFQKGAALRKKGMHAAAAIEFEKAIKLAPQAFGPDHVNTAALLNTLGATYLELARYRDAEGSFRRSLVIREARLDKDHLDVLRSMNNLALALSHLGQHQESETLFLRCLKLQEAKLGKDHFTVTETLSNLASLYNDAGRFTEAEPLLLRSLQARETSLGKDHRDVAMALNNLGEVYRAMSRLEEAEGLFRRSLTICESKWGKEDQHTAVTLNNLALVCERLTRYAEAEALLKRSLQIREARVGKNHPEVATSLLNLGMLFAHQGRHADAERYYQRSLEIRTAVLGPDHPKTALVLNHLANLYRDLGRTAEAEPLYRRALKIREAQLDKDHPDIARSLHDLAALSILKARYDEAETLYQRCVAIAERRLGKDDPEVGAYLDALGQLYTKTRRYAEAETCFTRALQINENRLGKDNSTVSANLNNLGLLYSWTGQGDKAERMLQRSLQITSAKSGATHHNAASCLQNLASVNHLLGKPAEALALQEKCLHIRELELRDVLAFSSEASVYDFLDTINGTLPTIVNLAATDRGSPAVAAALTWTLRLKGVALDLLCRYREAQHLVGPEDALTERIGRFRTVKQLLASSALSPPLGLSAEKLAQQTAHWRKEADELEAEINRVLGAKQHGLAGESEAITVASVRNQLAPATALVEFFRLPIRDFKADRWLAPRYIAFVLTPGDDPPRLIDLGDAKQIELGVESLRKEFTELQDKLKDAESAEEAQDLEKTHEKLFQKKSAALARQLFEPLRQALGTAQMVYLAPDSYLNRLPFEALVDGDGKYLIERYRFAYLSSGRDLLRAPVKAAKGTVVFAAPDYGLDAAQRQAQAEKLLAKKAPQIALGPTTALTVRSLGWKALPGAAAEAKDIQMLLQEGTFGPVKAYVGAEALEEVLKAMPAPRVLHLATHGFFLDHEPAAPPPAEDGIGAGWARGRLKGLDNPLLRSGIVLAGANEVGDKGQSGRADASRADDGWVTAEEIALLDLRGTELVVLSACQSGLGDVKSGEGVYGLRRAFLYAGARTMVTSLFEVPDQETRELMQRFYRELNAGQGKLAALHTAQRALIQQRRTKQGASHPFFWASFVLVGDPR